MEDEALRQVMAGGAGLGLLYALGKLFFLRAFNSIQEIRVALQQALIHIAEIRTELKIVPHLNESQAKLEKEVINLRVKFDLFEKSRNSSANSI